MSLKQEIETWVQALTAYDNNEFEESLKIFDNIADTSKILFNCGVIHATLGEHEKAVECYQRAVGLDRYLAVAYFQEGVSNFLVGDFEEALANFNDTLLYLRGNTYIDYGQLGLKFRLYSCEVLFNRGLCYIYLQQEKAGMQDFGYAVKEKVTPDHDVIDDAIREKAEGYTVFSIPVGVVYRPNEAKVKNLKTKDYLGKARLVASADRTNNSTGFQGSERKQAVAFATALKDDRFPENISFAATNLAHRGLSSRSGREQSAPPSMNRNMFPPTPPPDTDKPSAYASGRSSDLNSHASPLKTTTSKAYSHPRQDAKPQVGDVRSEQRSSLGRTNSKSPPGGQSFEPGVIREQFRLASPPQSRRPRLGTTRIASEPRRPVTRRQPPDRSTLNRPPLFRETTPQRPFETLPESQKDDVYDMCQSGSATGAHRSGSRMNGHNTRAQPQYIAEEEEIASDRNEDDHVLGTGTSVVDSSHPMGSHIGRPSETDRNSSRRAEVHKIRVKVHAKDDTRYIVIGPEVEYGDFEGKIREKFCIKSRLRIKMQDEGDMITMGDQDDLDMLLENAKGGAKRENTDMGKMEVWIQELI